MFLKVACVLKSGGDYRPEHVERLAANVERRIGVEYEFYCLTDLPIDGLPGGVRWVPLVHGLPSWWSKLEYFRMRGPVITFDLDLVLVGSLGPVASRTVAMRSDEFLMLRGFRAERWNSSLMAWFGDFSWVLDSFLQKYKTATHRVDRRRYHLLIDGNKYHGDQEWIGPAIESTSTRMAAMCEVFPGVYSYKNHLRGIDILPGDAWLVCFHGKPRPDEVRPVPGWMVANGYGE